MPRYYLRKLRQEHGIASTNGVEAAFYTGHSASTTLLERPVDVDAIAIAAVMTPDVATITGVLPDALETPAAGIGDGDAAGARRRRRRGRRGRGGVAADGQSPEPVVAAEEFGVLPGEPGLPPELVTYDESFVPDMPPSSHLAAMVQSGGLVLPDRRRRRRRGSTDGVTAEPPPAAPARLPEAPAARAGGGVRDRLTVTDEQVVRQTLLLDQLLQRQTAMLKAIERMMQVVERRGGMGGGSGGSYTASPRGAVFVDVPNIVYAAERIGVWLDWGKILAYLTRDRQLVRATAYAPVSDDPHQRIESQKFVQPFYNLPYRILTKPLKRFGNGEIKANFDVELAIDAITMADRLDIICLVSGDGDFRRMVEIVQAKGVRVEVIAFSSSTAGDLRTVCDDYLDISQHLHEFAVTR